MCNELPDNRTLSLHEIARAKTRLSSMPSLIFVEINTLCNLQCIMCRPNGVYSPAVRKMEFDNYRVMAETLFPTALRVEICGMGETLLHPDISKIITFADKFNTTRLSLTTNGTLLRGAVTEVISSRPVDVTVSVDGATPETYYKIRGKDKFQLVIDNITDFVSQQRLQPSSQRGTTVVQFTLQRANIEEFPLFVKLMARIGVECVSAHEVIAPFNKSLELPQDSQVIGHMEQAIRVAQDNHVRLLLPKRLAEPVVVAEVQPGCLGHQEALNDPFIHPDLRTPIRDRLHVLSKNNNEQSIRGCFEPYQTVLVRADMELFICCREKFYAGHFDANNFDSAWNGSAYKSLRGTINTLQRPDVCRQCTRC